jgi:hypothetical protein
VALPKISMLAYMSKKRQLVGPYPDMGVDVVSHVYRLYSRAMGARDPGFQLLWKGLSIDAGRR